MESKAMYAEDESPSFRRFPSRRIVLALFMLTITAGLAFFWFNSSRKTFADHPNSERVRANLTNPKTAPYYIDLIPDSTSSQKNAAFAKAPTFDIHRYTLLGALPSAGKDIHIYTFRTDFPKEYTDTLAKTLLGQNVQLKKSLSDAVVYQGSFGYLNFSKTSGAFSLKSFDLKVPFAYDGNKDISGPLADYLRDTLGIIDNTVAVTAHYKRDVLPGMTYYELHREHSRVGLPIINPLAAAQADEDEKLAQVSLTNFTTDDLADSSISYASDTPGKARRADFNTMTVAISDSGLIISIESNIRPIEKFASVEQQGLTLLSPQSAIKELENKGSYFDISFPSGAGAIDYRKVYVDNKLNAEQAYIKDVALVYIEKPFGVQQKYLQPAYIIRGITETASGVRVNFAQTVPAINGFEDRPAAMGLPNMFAYAQESEIITIPCGDGTSQICRWEKFKNTPTPVPPTPESTPSVTQPIATIVPPTPPSSSDDGCVVYNLNGELLETGNPVFMPGIGTVYYFQNLPSGPLLIRDTTAGTLYQETYFFEEQVENELLALGAQIALADPSRVQFRPTEAGSHVNLQTLYGLDTDIQNLGNEFHSLGDNGVGFDAPRFFWFSVGSRLTNAVNSGTLASLASGATPLHDAGLSNNTIWMARRTYYQFGITSDTYNNVRFDAACKPITTVSPLIYFYGEIGKKFSLIFNHNNVAYSDPEITRSADIQLEKNGIVVNGSPRDKIHYEYKNVALSQPKNMWSIPTDQLATFMKMSLRQQIGLTQQEASDLYQDVVGGLALRQKKIFINIGIVNEEEVAQKLPFTLSERPTTLRRIHLFVEPTDTKGIFSEPLVKKIVRTSFTVIELGVYVK